MVSRRPFLALDLSCFDGQFVPPIELNCMIMQHNMINCNVKQLTRKLIFDINSILCDVYHICCIQLYTNLPKSCLNKYNISYAWERWSTRSLEFALMGDTILEYTSCPLNGKEKSEHIVSGWVRPPGPNWEHSAVLGKNTEQEKHQRFTGEIQKR